MAAGDRVDETMGLDCSIEARWRSLVRQARGLVARPPREAQKVVALFPHEMYVG